MELTELKLIGTSFVEGNKMALNIFTKGKAIVVQLVSQEIQENNKKLYPKKDQLLLDFEPLFQEPLGLPPKTDHDHKIVLKEGTSPISTHPYRYPYY